MTISNIFKRAAYIIAIACSAAVIFSSTTITSASVTIDQSPETTFKTKCVACHGMDGSGTTPMGKKFKLRDLKSAEVQKQTDAQLLEIISKGKGKMPAYEKSLGADTCKALAGYIRELAKKK